MEKTKENIYTNFVFSTELSELTDEEISHISDEDFNDRYNEFVSLTITQDEIYEGFNYHEGYKKVQIQIEKDTLTNIQNIGIFSHGGKEFKWTLFEDLSYERDSLINLSFSTCIYSDKNYIWILACVFGEKHVQERMCQLFEVINTIKIE